MIWIIVLAIIVFIAYKFIRSLNEDNKDLMGLTLDKRFSSLATYINHAAFSNQGTIISKRNNDFAIYKPGSSQIVEFLYSAKVLTITWKFKYMQQEMIHRKDIQNPIIKSEDDLLNIAEKLAYEVSDKMKAHINKIDLQNIF